MTSTQHTQANVDDEHRAHTSERRWRAQSTHKRTSMTSTHKRTSMTSTQHTQANVDDETDRKQLLTTTAQINGQSINTSTYFFLLLNLHKEEIVIHVEIFHVDTDI